MLRPIFPAGVTYINSEVAFQERDGKVYYFNGHLPVFVHETNALATFRLFSTQLVINGNATQAVMLARSAIRLKHDFQGAPEAAQVTACRKALLRDRNQTIMPVLFTFQPRPDALCGVVQPAQPARIHTQCLKLSNLS